VNGYLTELDLLGELSYSISVPKVFLPETFD